MKSKKITVLAALVLGRLFALNASAQQLYVSAMDTWYKNGGTGYCDDIGKKTVDVTGTVGGIFLRDEVEGVMYRDNDGDAVSDSSSAATANISGAFTGTVGGPLISINNAVSGNVTGSVTAAGGVNGQAASTVGTVNFTCTNTLAIGEMAVSGVVDSLGYATVTVNNSMISSPITCTNGVAVANGTWWVPSAPSNLRLIGTLAGTLYGYDSNVADEQKVSFIGEVWRDSARIEFERPQTTYPGACLGLCASIVCVSTVGVFGIDELTFEVFKFGPGANPLDPASTPPIKTISMYNLNRCTSSNNEQQLVGTYCAAWDGAYNLNGMFGKTNGQFGFRAKVKTNQVSPTAGNISIEQTAAYPGQNQIPIQVNVTNIHSLRSSPTVVGKITGVAAQPYNILYRLSKDAITLIDIYDANTQGTLSLVRNLIDTPRTGEGAPDGTLTNGDFWDGRDNQGNFVPAGNYIAEINAWSNDADTTFDTDVAWPVHAQLSLDPLQITDVAIKPLGASSTDVATISYMLTEAATVYLEIYPPGTTFGANTAPGGINQSPPGNASAAVLRRFVEQKDRRVMVTTFWDGRDSGGMPVCDGDYVYALYAIMPTGSSLSTDGTVRTLRTLVGTLPVARGPVVAMMNPSSTVLGSSPAVAGLDPFYFRYTPVRDASVSLNIRDMNNTIVRRVITEEQRFANFSNRELWDGKGDDGRYVAAGTYMAELITKDPYQCTTVRTSTVTTLVPVNMFRIVDVKTQPLLGGSSDTAKIAFQLTQSMFVELNIYNTYVELRADSWPPSKTGVNTPVYNVAGIRPGRFNITEYWDGRNNAGTLMDDGRYPFSIVAYSTGTATGAPVIYAADKVYGYIDIARGKIIFTLFEVIPSIPTMYNSSDTIKLPPYEIDYVITRQSSVTVQVWTLESPPRLKANITLGQIRDGDMLYKDFWDGKDENGAWLNGYYVGSEYTHAYNIRVTAQDIASQLTSLATAQQTIDVFPLRIYDVSITPLTLEQPAVISYQVSEPMKVVTKVYKPGTSFNSSGTPFPPETNSIVKRIIGVRPSRTQISEYWDGTDLTLSKVPDGNYVFKLYASTDSTAINTLDGSYGLGAMLADDIIIANLPVTKGGTPDLCGDFSHDTFFAPNPYTGTAGWFRIPIAMNGRVDLKIFNLAGDLVFKRDFGVRGAGNDIDGSGKCSAGANEACWQKVNMAGKTVAPGVYFAVIRYEANEGTRDICQVVKKILVP